MQLTQSWQLWSVSTWAHSTSIFGYCFVLRCLVKYYSLQNLWSLLTSLNKLCPFLSPNLSLFYSFSLDCYFYHFLIKILSNLLPSVLMSLFWITLFPTSTSPHTEKKITVTIYSALRCIFKLVSLSQLLPPHLRTPRLVCLGLECRLWTEMNLW